MDRTNDSAALPKSGVQTDSFCCLSDVIVIILNNVSYLTQRTQCVSVDNVTSELVNLVYGVPQGSVLGPLKFCLYTLPLDAIILYHGLNFHMYADDTKLYIAFDHSDSVSYLNQLNACILDIRSWMITNKVKINDNKTEFLVITSPYVKLSSPDFQLNVGSCTIDTSSSVRNLGVLFVSHMNLEGHVTNVWVPSFASQEYSLNKKIFNR